MKEQLIIAVDFDGTCVTHEFPEVGRDIGAVPTLQALVACGHKLILWTMRSNQEIVQVSIRAALDGIQPEANNYLDQAVQWFKDNDIELYGINENPAQKAWTSSPKAFANMYVDDAALGCPKRLAGDVERPFVDWTRLGDFFIQEGIIAVQGDDDAGK